MAIDLVTRLQFRFGGTSGNVTVTPDESAKTASFPYEVTSGTSGTPDFCDADNFREWYQESAAIMEHCGGMSRIDAERIAKLRTRVRFRLPLDYRLH